MPSASNVQPVHAGSGNVARSRAAARRLRVEDSLIGFDQGEESGLFHDVLLTLFDRCVRSMAGAHGSLAGWAVNPEECLAKPWSRDEERGSILRFR